MTTFKKLPIGIQTFRDIRDPKERMVYIDKTADAYRMATRGRYYFLARPRRFGKSLFLDTLSELFKGSKHLFEGLYIYDKWDWTEQFPVIKISLAGGEFWTEEKTNTEIREILFRNCENLALDAAKCAHENLSIFFARIISQAYSKYAKKVVILIDEYDKPILDNIHLEDKKISTEIRNLLRSFYGIIKNNDEYIRLVFITGVSKFSKLNLFSGLNNLEDITIDPNYATITGYSHQDLVDNFSEYLENVDLNELKRWYNGYNYFGEPVYNPFDILLFFSQNNEFKNYWWETGGTSFLIEILKKQPQFLPELENIVIGSETLNAFDVEHIDLVALLWQTGYLTFDQKINDGGDVFYKLKVPNLEVQKSLNHLFFVYLSNLGNQHANFVIRTKNALRTTNLSSFEIQLRALFAAIPYENYVNNQIGHYEGYYASVVFAFLSSFGFSVVTEDSTNTGRVDMTLIGPEQVFILEFKVDMPAEAALEQIKTKKYYEKYLSSGKKIILIGIHFDSKIRNIAGFEWEEFV